MDRRHAIGKVRANPPSEESCLWHGEDDNCKMHRNMGLLVREVADVKVINRHMADVVGEIFEG